MDSSTSLPAISPLPSLLPLRCSENLGRVRSPSPVFHLSSDDDTLLDPALRQIRNANNDDEIQIVTSHTAPSAEDKVTLRVSMVFDPTRVASKAAIAGYQKQIDFELGTVRPPPLPAPSLIPPQTESFSNLYTALADRKGLDADSLVLTHNDHRVYPFGTPRSLKIFPSADFRGYTKEVWAKVLAAKTRVGKQEVLEENVEEEVVEEELENKEEKLFKITVRGSALKVLPLAVRRTILLSALLKQYCRTFKVPDEVIATMWMEFDGGE